MSKSRIVDKKTGRVFPKQEKNIIMKKFKNHSKFFGWTSGDNGKIANDGSLKVKGDDYIKYGYPAERRSASELKRHIENSIFREEMDELNYVE